MEVGHAKEAIVLIQSRLTLFPHGPSDTKYREDLETKLIYCGADGKRIVEANCNGDLVRYCKFIKQFEEVSRASDDKTPIMVMTKTTLLVPNLISVRDKLSSEFPALEKALWIVFSPEDEFFQQNASEAGRFIMATDRPPIWVHERNKPDGGKMVHYYLVLAPKTPPSTARAGAEHYNDLIRPRRASSTFRINDVQTLLDEQRNSRP